MSDGGAHDRLIAHLREIGVPQPEVERAAAEDRLALLGAEHVLTGGGERLSLRDVARAAGADIDTLRRVVGALGLPVPPDDAPVAGDEDVEAARTIGAILAAGLDPDGLLEAVRVAGQSAAVTSRAFVTLAGSSVLSDAGDELEVALRLEAVARDLAPVVERLGAYLLRRHLLEAVRAQALTEADVEAAAPGRARTVAVGFGDLSGFTRLGARLDPAETGRMAARFGELASGVAQRPVQLVKLVGDGAMLVSAEPVALVDGLLALRDAVGAEGEDFPHLHAGAALGPAVPRAGDWFGHTVALASRLCHLARAGSVLADGALAGELGDAHRLSRLPPVRMRGIPERVAVFRVRRAGETG